MHVEPKKKVYEKWPQKEKDRYPRNKFTLHCINVCCDYKTRHGFYKTLLQRLNNYQAKEK